MSSHRDLCDIAAEIKTFAWAKSLPAGARGERWDANPNERCAWVLARLQTIKGLTEMVGLDTGEELVAMFLLNSGWWRAHDQNQSLRIKNARRILEIKRELYEMLSPRIIKKFWPEAWQRKVLSQIYSW